MHIDKVHLVINKQNTSESEKSDGHTYSGVRVFMNGNKSEGIYNKLSNKHDGYHIYEKVSELNNEKIK